MSTILRGSLLTVDETAKLLDLSRVTVYRRVERGELEAVHLGDGPKAPIRIPADSLATYLAAHMTGGSA